MNSVDKRIEEASPLFWGPENYTVHALNTFGIYLVFIHTHIYIYIHTKIHAHKSNLVLKKRIIHRYMLGFSPGSLDFYMIYNKKCNDPGERPRYVWLPRHGIHRRVVAKARSGPSGSRPAAEEPGRKCRGARQQQKGTPLKVVKDPRVHKEEKTIS